MSRRLQTLKEQYVKTSAMPALIEYLEECRKEKLWEAVIETLDGWQGNETSEIFFYKGVALLNLGKREEGAELLNKVIKSNPNHFLAKREIENFGINENSETSVREESDALKKILIVNQIPQDTAYSKNVFLKNVFLAVILIVSIFALGFYFLREDKADKYNDMLKNPHESFTSLTYSEYVNRVRELKIIDIKDNIGDPLKRSILWITALAMADFHLDTEKEDFSHFKMFSTLVTDKSEQLKEIVDYLETGAVPKPPELYHKLDLDYPGSLAQIRRLDIEQAGEITKKSLRAHFYNALMFFRRSEFQKAELIINDILGKFPDYELAVKLDIMIRAGKSIDNNIFLKDISKDLAILEKWKTFSQERYYLGEAKILLGRASEKDEVISEGFYSVCPGRYFCRETVDYFLKKNDTATASRMALFMKEQKENKRDADDVKLVIETSYADKDYSNCYFSFRELVQFFKDQVDDKTLLTGGECSVKNGYFEEAVKIYEEINAKNPDVFITAEILRMKYRLTGEELYYTQLKNLAEKNSERKDVLYSFLDILKKRGDIRETIGILKKIYKLESDDRKLIIIGEYLNAGAVFQTVENLEELRNDKTAAKMLSDIYNRYMLFELADSVLLKDQPIDPLWIFFREQLKLKESGEYEIVASELEKRMATLDRCEPALIYLRAEAFRNLGDKQRTFSMIDSLLECDRHYIPGLVLASEITYYQGDFTKAQEGIQYLLENEKFLSPGKLYYHNFLVLLNAEIMVALGKESRLLRYLSKNLIKDVPLGQKEMEKISDISEKLKESMQNELNNFLKRNYKFINLKKPEQPNSGG